MLKSITFTTPSLLMSAPVPAAGRELKLESRMDKSMTVIPLSELRSPWPRLAEAIGDGVGTGTGAGAGAAEVISVLALMAELLLLMLPK